MLKLNSDSPCAATLGHLARQQASIDSLVTDQRAPMAQTLWDAKHSTADGRAAFADVKQTLLGMCVGTELCNYCENSVASDVEHVYPKSFFPERAFAWMNYLLACSPCNSRFKRDQFAVFSPVRSANATTMQRKKLPASADAAFIDPRVEDPMDFLRLDITGKSFFLQPSPTLTDPRDLAKAEHTLSILQIGERSSLVEPRKLAFRFFQNRLERYQHVRDAKTLADLERLVEDPDLIDASNTFEDEQQLMLTSLRQSILRYPHPTVWREMQRQHHLLNKVKKLFEAVPEALGWK